jgi:hypothetical protein
MDKSLLLSQKTEHHTYEIEGLGTVKLRALTRAEALEISELGKKGASEAEIERKVLVNAIVDPTDLTEDDIAEWQAVSPAGQIQPVIERAMEISGLVVGSDKNAYKSNRK